MSEQNRAGGRTGGIGFFGLLTILFIGLKLGDVIAWSWFMVFIPIWLPILLLIFAGMFALLIYVLRETNKNKKSK